MTVKNLVGIIPEGWELRSIVEMHATSNRRPGSYYVEIWTGANPILWGEGPTLTEAMGTAISHVLLPTEDNSDV